MRDLTLLAGVTTMDAGDVVRLLDHVYFEAVHERETLANLDLLIRDGDVVVDVGSSLGQYPWFLNRRFQRLMVLCVEADELRFRELDKRCRRWTDEGRNNLVTINAAACAHEGVATFFTTSSNLSGSLLETSKPADASSARVHGDEWSAASAAASGPARPSPVQVRAVTLDSLCKDVAPALVKVDTEGAELEVVRGATRLLGGGATKFLIERDSRCDHVALEGLFTRHGYREARFFNHDLFYHPSDPRRPPLATIAARRVFYRLLRPWWRPDLPVPSKAAAEISTPEAT